MIVKVRNHGNPLLDVIEIPIEAATVLEPGMPVSYESGYAVPLDAATEDATFAGIALDKHVAGDTYPGKVLVELTCKVDAPVASGAYTIGQALAYNASNKNFEASTADTMLWSLQDTAGGNVTTLKCLVDVRALGKLFPVNA